MQVLARICGHAISEWASAAGCSGSQGDRVDKLPPYALPPTTPPRTPRPPPPPAPEPVPQAHPAATVTMRFDEFVAWWDAAGFGPGHRSPLAVEWPRIAAWAALATVAIGAAAFWVATGR